MISTIKKTNIGSILLLNRGPPLCDYACPIGLLPTEPEQLLEMTELVSHLVLCMEVFRNLIGAANLGGLATLRECLYLHNQLPWKPWCPLPEMIHNHCLSQRLGDLLISVLALLSWTAVPHFLQIKVRNSHPPFLYKPGPPWPIKRTKRWTPCLVLLLYFLTLPSLVPLLLWLQVSLFVYVHWIALLLCSPRMFLCQHPHALGEPVIIRPLCSSVSSRTPCLLIQKLVLKSSQGFRAKFLNLSKLCSVLLCKGFQFHLHLGYF